MFVRRGRTAAAAMLSIWTGAVAFALAGLSRATPAPPPELFPFTVAGDSVTIVPVNLAYAGSLGADLAFLIDTTVVQPDENFVRAHAFESEASSIFFWNAVGDTVFVSVSSPYYRDLSGIPLVELAFRGKHGVPAGTVAVLTLLPYPFTAMNEHGLAVEEGDRNGAAAVPLSAAPNPFNAVTTIRFVLPAASAARVTVFAASGQAVRTLVAHGVAGACSVVWDGRDSSGRPLASGVYVCEVRTASGRSAIRITLAR